MRRTYIPLLVALVIGLVAGVGTAIVRVRMVRVDTEAIIEGGSLVGKYVGEDAPRPKVVVDQPEFDFGTMKDDATQSHSFIFRNAGDDTLTLTKGDTTCRCTLIDLEEGDHTDVPPGGSATVTLQWTSKNQAGPYRQSATIFTNDPDRSRVTLTISGLVASALKVSPNELVFSQLSAGETATEEVRLFCYSPETLQITGWKLEDASTADKFEVEHEPLSADQLQKELDRLGIPSTIGRAGEAPSGQQKTVGSGYVVRVTVKPGLPLGAFRQKILLKTNLDESPTVELPVEGTVSGDISIAGRGWNEKSGVLTLGVVDGAKGLQRDLFLACRGPHRNDVAYNIGHVEPEWLKVELGERTEINRGKVIRTSLRITIPKGTMPANHLGSEQGSYGRITIDTNHPQVPHLQILLRFAVEG